MVGTEWLKWRGKKPLLWVGWEIHSAALEKRLEWRRSREGTPRLGDGRRTITNEKMQLFGLVTFTKHGVYMQKGRSSGRSEDGHGFLYIPSFGCGGPCHLSSNPGPLWDCFAQKKAVGVSLCQFLGPGLNQAASFPRLLECSPWECWTPTLPIPDRPRVGGPINSHSLVSWHPPRGHTGGPLCQLSPAHLRAPPKSVPYTLVRL